jgi:hypothetical protein
MSFTNVFKKALIICSIIFTLNPINTAIANNDYNVSVQGIRIVGNGHKTSSEEIMPFNQFKGSALSCLLTISSGRIVSFNEVESSIKAFKDNVGTSLMDSEAMFGNGFGMMRDISKDGSAFLFEITGSELPAKKATSLDSSGVIVINTASHYQSQTIKHVALKKGVVIHTAIGTVTISDIKKNTWGNAPFGVTFESKEDLTAIKRVEFKTMQGDLIESECSGNGSHNIVGDVSSLTFEQEYSLA